jgi:hypothetical protein
MKGVKLSIMNAAEVKEMLDYASGKCDNRTIESQKLVRGRCRWRSSGRFIRSWCLPPRTGFWVFPWVNRRCQVTNVFVVHVYFTSNEREVNQTSRDPKDSNVSECQY